MSASFTAFASRRPWSALLPWLLGGVAAAAFCSGYLQTFVYRNVWKSHYPNLASTWANDGRFALVGWYGTELASEELAYAARVVEASRRFPAYDPYIKENRTSRQFVIDALTYAAMAAVHRFVGEINWTWLVLRFFSCAAWFALVYLLMLRAGRSPPVAVFCATIVSLFSYWMILYFVDHLSLSSPFRSVWALLSYGRTEGVLRLPRPGVTYAFLFLATLVSVKAAEARSWAWAAAAGVLGGALAYVRLDVWTAHCLALAIFTLAAWRTERAFPARLFAACVIAAALSLPYVLQLYPPDPDLLVRAGILPRRRFDPASLGYLLVGALVLAKRKGPAERFLGSMCLSNFFLVNIELVLGHPLQPEHWKYFANLYVFLALTAFIPERWQAREGPWLAASAVLAGVAFLQGTVYAAIHFPFQGLPKHYDEALSWAKSNTPSDAVFFTLNPEIVGLLPVYAEKKLLAGHPLPVVSTFNMTENLRRLAGGAKLLDLDFERFLQDTVYRRQTANDRREVVASGLFRGEIEKNDVYHAFFCTAPFPKAEEAILEAKARPADLEPDYFWLGHFEREYAGRSPAFLKSKRWREVYRNPAVAIYERTR